MKTGYTGDEIYSIWSISKGRTEVTGKQLLAGVGTDWGNDDRPMKVVGQDEKYPEFDETFGLVDPSTGKFYIPGGEDPNEQPGDVWAQFDEKNWVKK